MGKLEIIKRCFTNNNILYTHHALEEMRNEKFGRIYDKEIGECIISGEIIKEYPEDTPYPSFLILGKTGSGRPLHVVCAYGSESDVVIVITTYQPDPALWIDYKRRIQQ